MSGQIKVQSLFVNLNHPTATSPFPKLSQSGLEVKQITLRKRVENNHT